MAVHRTFARYGGPALLAALCIALTGCGLLGRTPPGLVEAETWLPGDTVMVAGVRDVGAAHDGWSATASGRAWSSPAVEFWCEEQVLPAWSALLDRLGAGNASEVLDLADGPALIAMALPVAAERSGEGDGEQQRPPLAAFYGLIDFGENAVGARARLAGLWPGEPANVLPEGWNAGEERHERVRSSGGPLAWPVTSAWVGSVLVVGSWEEGVRDIVRRGHGRSGERAEPLVKNATWLNGAAERSAEDDLFMLVDVAAAYDRLSAVVRDALTLSRRTDVWMRLQKPLTALGIGSVRYASLSIDMREGVFHTRGVTVARDGMDGLMFLTDANGDLVTPSWLTTESTAFQAMRLRPLTEIKALVLEAASPWSPALGRMEKTFSDRMEERIGLNLDGFLECFGAEFATLQHRASPRPETVVLWRIQRKEFFEALDRIRQIWNVQVSKQTYLGKHYEANRLLLMPKPVYTAHVDGFLMLATGDAWFKHRVDLDRALEAAAQAPEPSHPAGPTSLLPRLEAPFGPVPEGLHVVGRSISEPGPTLRQINTYLPLAVPMLNLQLRQYGARPVPDWMIGALPPLLPFAQEPVVTVTRTLQGPDRVVSEYRSELDPFWSPVAATVFVVLSKAMEASVDNP